LLTNVFSSVSTLDINYVFDRLQFLVLRMVGCVAQWKNIGLSPANFPCHALGLQLTGNPLCG